MKKALVAYFSASGVTAQLARTLTETVDGDLFEIVPAQPYTAADLNWTDKKSRSTIEMKDAKSRPAIAETVRDMQRYDVVFVGFPIWWYEAPRIVQSFLEAYDLSGKTIVPFATSGGSGMGKSASILQKSCPGAHVVEDRRLNGRASQAELSQWGRLSAAVRSKLI